MLAVREHESGVQTSSAARMMDTRSLSAVVTKQRRFPLSEFVLQFSVVLRRCGGTLLAAVEVKVWVAV